MIKLYNHPLSGNSYKARLALSSLGVEYERVNVDVFKGEQHAEGFRLLTPAEKIPVLTDGDFVIWESNAILLYLGKRFAPNEIYSEEPETFGRIAQWLLFGKTTIDPALAPARYMMRFIPEEEWDRKRLEQLRESGGEALKILDRHLGEHDFLAGGYSVADIGCYPYVALAHEGGVDVAPYERVSEWCDRVRSQKGFIPMES